MVKMPWKERIMAAIVSLKDPSGSSLFAIKKALGAEKSQWRFINTALKKGIAKGDFTKSSVHLGAGGKYKVVAKNHGSAPGNTTTLASTTQQRPSHWWKKYLRSDYDGDILALDDSSMRVPSAHEVRQGVPEWFSVTDCPNNTTMYYATDNETFELTFENIPDVRKWIKNRFADAGSESDSGSGSDGSYESSDFDDDDEDEDFMKKKQKVRKVSSTTGFRGVYPYNKSGRFKAIINVDGKQKGLGSFDTREDAAIAYDCAVRKYKLPLYRLNFPSSNEKKKSQKSHSHKIHKKKKSFKDDSFVSSASFSERTSSRPRRGKVVNYNQQSLEDAVFEQEPRC